MENEKEVALASAAVHRDQNGKKNRSKIQSMKKSKHGNVGSKQGDAKPNVEKKEKKKRKEKKEMKDDKSNNQAPGHGQEPGHGQVDIGDPDPAAEPNTRTSHTSLCRMIL